MERQQKELLEAIDEQINHLKLHQPLHGIDPYWSSWHKKRIAHFQALRRLVEKFYGEWKPRLQKFSAEMEDKNSTRPIEASMAKIIVESWKIRDFDPMASDEGEKGGRR